jgi:hypothetical protein
MISDETISSALYPNESFSYFLTASLISSAETVFDKTVV